MSWSDYVIIAINIISMLVAIGFVIKSYGFPKEK